MMKKYLKLIFSLKIIFLISACNVPVSESVTTVPQSIPTLQTVPQPTNTFTPSPEPTATNAPAGIFKLVVLVDTSAEPVTREQAQIIIDESSQILYRLTNFVFEMVDFREVQGGDMRAIADAYLSDPMHVASNGIIIFSYGDDDTAKLYGGYAFTRPGPTGFINQFVAPNSLPNVMYVGVSHFGHRYSQCGYGDSETPISNVSIGGECRGVEGVACVEKFGYQMCSTAVDNLTASTPTYFTSQVFVHEIMHPFGKSTVKDHYFTAECTEIMASGISTRKYTSSEFISAESQFYTNMCPYVFDNFINSYNP
jgi:hypothetical protein